MMADQKVWGVRESKIFTGRIRDMPGPNSVAKKAPPTFDSPCLSKKGGAHVADHGGYLAPCYGEK